MELVQAPPPTYLHGRQEVCVELVQAPPPTYLHDRQEVCVELVQAPPPTYLHGRYLGVGCVATPESCNPLSPVCRGPSLSRSVCACRPNYCLSVLLWSCVLLWLHHAAV